MFWRNCVFFLLSASCIAQTALPKAQQPIVRDPAAVEVVRASITALGGTVQQSSSTAWVATGSSIIQQTTRPLHIEIRGREFRVERGSGGTQSVLTSGFGTPVIATAAQSKRIASLSVNPIVLPLDFGDQLATRLANPEYSIEQCPAMPEYDVVKIVNHHTSLDEYTSTQYWYIDHQTKLPHEIRYFQRLPNKLSVFGTTILRVDSYKQYDSLLAPERVTYLNGDVVMEEMRFESISRDSQVAENRFQSPEAAK